ncbi:hypothetical protein [Roseibium aggregatum]|uniref:Peptidase M41 domain-containing protein n=1 Tax=Roseibium aggregatum TaxID=187304 RepID=A0A926NZ17_9HYPH|nr:hypothetical protein [Roseibium aggregatum]MBD1546245.1 hypothetical protein [Roseibium aggregatum]
MKRSNTIYGTGRHVGLLMARMAVRHALRQCVDLQYRTAYLDKIAVLLAGHAAEGLFFDEPSDGSGLVAGSDLERATLLAARLMASSGLADDLIFRSEISGSALRNLIKNDRVFAGDCNQILGSQRKRVTALLKRKKHQLRAVSDSLLRSKTLSSEQISTLLNSTQINNKFK